MCVCVCRGGGVWRGGGRETKDASIWKSIMVILVLWLAVLTTYFLAWEYIIPSREGVNLYIKNKYGPARLLTSLRARQILMLGKERARSERRPRLALLQTLEHINPRFGQRCNELCAAGMWRQADRWPCVVSVVFVLVVVNVISGRDITLVRAAVWI